VDAVAGSQGGGVKGYGAAYLVIGGVAVMLTCLTLGLKSRSVELASQQTHAQAVAQEAAQEATQGAAQ
jgi:hypothetical protein